MTRLRTSLCRAPSTITEEEQAESLEAYERRLWADKRAMVIRMEDKQVPGLVRIWAEARAKARWGL